MSATTKGFFGFDDDLLLIICVVVVIFLIFPSFGHKY